MVIGGIGMSLEGNCLSVFIDIDSLVVRRPLSVSLAERNLTHLPARRLFDDSPLEPG